VLVCRRLQPLLHYCMHVQSGAIELFLCKHPCYCHACTHISTCNSIPLQHPTLLTPRHRVAPAPIEHKMLVSRCRRRECQSRQLCMFGCLGRERDIEGQVNGGAGSREREVGRVSSRTGACVGVGRSCMGRMIVGWSERWGDNSECKQQLVQASARVHTRATEKGSVRRGGEKLP